MIRSKKYKLNKEKNSYHPNSMANMMMMMNNGANLAVVVQSVLFNYAKNVPLLKNVSINVPKGNIYSLLGPNGCGKTTLLNILLGRIKPHSGEISILAQSPGTSLNHSIGFMPQELGLNPFLNIQDTFYYFARVNHVNDDQIINEQIRNYLEMLGLNDPKKRVGTLSGGQKRLLSLGVTLIYKPKILFLDEPTVGIDSLIRNKIWTHLRQLCQINGTTIIITTHYIDEAKESDLVGFLHEGHLLAEHKPEILMHYLECKTLEQVFLKLCYENIDENSNSIADDKRETKEDGRRSKKSYFLYNNESTEKKRSALSVINNLDDNNNNFKCQNQYDNKVFISDENNNETMNDIKRNSASWPMNTNGSLNRDAGEFDFVNTNHENDKYSSSTFSTIKLQLSTITNEEIKKPCRKKFLNFEHLYALMCREWFFFNRNLILFSFYIIIPMFTVYLFDSSYGRTPRNVPIGIFNGDETDFQPRLSNIFLDEFNTSMVKMNFYPTEDEAVDSVTMGKNVMAITFRKDFSSALVAKYYEFHSFDQHKKDTDIDGSMHVYLDHSSLLNVRYVNRSILLAFQRMIEKFGASKGINSKIFALPIDKKEYVYGELEPHFQDLFTPGVIIIMLLGINAGKSAFELIYLNQNGCLQRDINQGVKPFELLLTFIVSSMVSIFWQTVLTMTFTFFVMDVELKGDFLAVFILVYITACQGLFIGTFFSVLYPDQIIAMLLVFTLLVIMFLTSGTLWPLEGMSMTIQKLFMINPIVLPVRSFRFIMLRGWSMWHISVLVGYIISFSFCAALFILSSVFFHYSNIHIN